VLHEFLQLARLVGRHKDLRLRVYADVLLNDGQLPVDLRLAVLHPQSLCGHGHVIKLVDELFVACKNTLALACFFLIVITLTHVSWHW